MLAAVRAVSVDRDWPHRLVITVTERQPVAVVALVGAAPFGMAAQSQATQSGGAELVDAEGVAFAAVESAPAGLLPLVLGAPVPGAGDAQARAALQVWASVPFALRQLVVGIEAPSPVDVVLRLTGRRTVVWGGPGETARKVAVLRALMTRSATTYDVSTPDVPVTRP
jgi:cell division protein FtsQ